MKKYSILMKILSSVHLNKDVVHVYFDKNQIIGVIGFKSFTQKENAFLYIGASVLDERYQKYGLLTYSLLQTILATYLYYPTKYKYAMALATTPQAYYYFAQVLYEYWPRYDKPTPQTILEVMVDFLRVSQHNNFHITNGAVVYDELINKIQELHPKEIHNLNVKNYLKV